MTKTIDPKFTTPIRALTDLDAFTQAYIITALWSSRLAPFASCAGCNNEKVLSRWNDEREPVCNDCGTRDSNYEPPADDNYDWSDIDPETLAAMRQDCAQFQELYGATIQAAIETGEVVCGPDFDEWGRAGHDFWLTRCGHGAGFWDGDWPEPQGEHLSDAARKCGNIDLYVGDNGKIYA